MKKINIIAVLILIIILSCQKINVKTKNKTIEKENASSNIDFNTEFDEESALNFVKIQTDIGIRNYGSKGHKIVKEVVKEEIKKMGYKPISHNFNAPYIADRNGENIYAILKGKTDKHIVIASHFDSRSVAEKDKDLNKRDKPIIGANDGASSTGVLLELMRVFKKYEGELPYSMAFVFFDLEDDGALFNVEYKSRNILQTDWIQGSIMFVKDNVLPKEKIYFGILLDMVGSSDANFSYESYAYAKNSYLYNSIWNTAKKMGYEKYFRNEHYGVIIDDHTPFLEDGSAFIDIIDMSYKYHHTSEDTFDKIDKQTLKATGNTVEYFIKNVSTLYR